MNIREFCEKCEHKNVKANEYPCCMCMEFGINKIAGKPLGFERKEIEI